MAILLTEEAKLKTNHIPYYDDFISHPLKLHLLKKASVYPGVDHVKHIGKSGGLENAESLKFLCELYDIIKEELGKVLSQRNIDRKFLDERTKILSSFNKEFKIDYQSPEYKTTLNLEDGDGWKYRGRGILQLTGKENYKNTGNALGVDLIALPELLTTPKYACLSAGHFWSKKALNALADVDNYQEITKRINGGQTGLMDRIYKTKKAEEVLLRDV